MSDSNREMFEIDGGIMEGGGQILRMVTCLSALLRRPAKVFNIRAGRMNPGLRPQHLCGIKLVTEISAGQLEGGEIGSTVVALQPGPLTAGNYEADTGTAGSIGLLMQVSLPCLFLASASSELTLAGGTDTDMAPPMDYITEVLQPALQKFGLQFLVNILKRGYYPQGGGAVNVRVEPVSSIRPIQMLDRGEVTVIRGRSFVAGHLPIKVAHTMADSAIQVLRRVYGAISLTIERVKEAPEKATGNGSGIFLFAETTTGCRLAGSALAARARSSKDLGENAAIQLVQNLKHGGCVDNFLQDQLIIFMALAEGKSQVKCGPLTDHTQTAIHVVQQMTSAKLTVERVDATSFIIECDGIGLKASKLSE